MWAGLLQQVFQRHPHCRLAWMRSAFPSALRASALPRQSMDSLTGKLSVGSENHEFGDQAWKAKLM